MSKQTESLRKTANAIATAGYPSIADEVRRAADTIDRLDRIANAADRWRMAVAVGEDGTSEMHDYDDATEMPANDATEPLPFEGGEA